ncbi:bifunctional DNA primase/polymerase [Actinoalloteichus sp. GBA129-24]|uniref:bifunctional DNA primase/polymerase n=1 Tax=Actinoalloteichus sp. GBA129-24 TaxID=1612551 RepID=UPI00095051EA|nr:bifunctional DNA primase/polymerase [Actinoalloteichus sp. GBA129-24]APU20143.1 bifunctional DNA primase/polymerase famiily protein [Actinoalloteichus sp. GBA129-24]
MTGNIRSALRSAALDAAGRGWPVFPLRAPNDPIGAKKPASFFHSVTRCTRQGYCRDGHQGWEELAITDPDRIERAWSRSTHNVGIACGRAGLLVIDLDQPKPGALPPKEAEAGGGIEWGADVLTALCEQYGHDVAALWETYTVTTPRGGVHLYFRQPHGVRLGNTQGGRGTSLGELIDTRGHGGYVVAPGSITPDGAYRLVEDLPPAPLPGWLVRLLAPRPSTAVSRRAVTAASRLPSYVDAAIRGECERVATAALGAHSRVLLASSIALGQLCGGGALPPATAASDLADAAQHMITNPKCDCTAREITRTITNGLHLGSARPRRIPNRKAA